MNFDKNALNWDTEKRINRAKIIAHEIFKSIPIKEGYQALEFGCGTGLVSFNLVDKFEHITLIDSSEGMIQKLKDKIKDCKVRNMTAMKLDINEDVNKLVHKFDVIYTSMAMHHIKDIERTLKNLYTIIKDGGYICLVDLDEDDGSFHKLEKDFDGHNGFKQSEMKELFEKIGFQDVISYSFYKDAKIIEEERVDYSLFIMTGKK